MATIWERLATSTPINRQAVKAVTARGGWEPAKQLKPYGYIRSDAPMVTRPFPVTSDKKDDLTGLKVGRLTVIGMSFISAHGKGASWVVRCLCGWYEVRKAKALRDPAYSKKAMCSECDYMANLRAGNVPARPIILTVEKGEMRRGGSHTNVDDAAKIGFTRRPGGCDRHRIAWEIVCSKCPKKFSAYWEMNFKPEGMIKQMRTRKWEVGYNQDPLCPDCAHPRKVKVPVPVAATAPPTAIADELVRASVELIVKQPDIPILDLPTLPTPLKLSGHHVEIKMSNKPNPSPKVAHAVFQALDTHFDGEKRRYTGNGWDDARVAKEAGTTEEIVAYLRNETFGALAEDPRVQKIADDLLLLEMQIEEVVTNSKRAFRDLNSRLDQLKAALAR
ncbi:MAG TPA: hypothetical protein VGN16_09675 [Acidobacteriaceae bacterium]|jgi:hypothetical protein